MIELKLRLAVAKRTALSPYIPNLKDWGLRAFPSKFKAIDLCSNTPDLPLPCGHLYLIVAKITTLHAKLSALRKIVSNLPIDIVSLLHYNS